MFGAIAEELTRVREDPAPFNNNDGAMDIRVSSSKLRKVQATGGRNKNYYSNHGIDAMHL